MSKSTVSKKEFNEIMSECTLLKEFTTTHYDYQLNTISMYCDIIADKYEAEYKDDTSKAFKKRLAEYYREYGRKIYYFLNDKGFYA